MLLAKLHINTNEVYTSRRPSFSFYRGSDSFDDCLAGGGYATGDTLVQRALNIGIPENSNFVYMIYPCAELPNNSIIYFRQPGYNEWIAYYNYDSGEWALYPGHSDNGGPAHNYFTLPQ